jgi:Epoxide hydrolase N terminus
MPDGIEPFVIGVDATALDDLRDRLRRSRWPEREPVGDWSQGVPLGYLQELCGYWAEGYDWRATEARLNQIPQFTTTIDGLDIHFLHIRSPHPGAVPLVMTHGWPGSFLEFEQVLGPLTDPPAHGRRVRRGRAIAARLRVQRQAAGPRLGHPPHRPRMGRADDPAGLRPVPGHRQRLGHQRVHQPGAAAPRPAAGYPPGAAAGAAGPRRRRPDR